jgi:heme-degrading monooxygenase HmoA
VARIAEDQDVVTLINVLTVAPEDQERLVELLARATEEVIAHRPGFVSANIHRGLDGTRVANYAQWRTREDFEAMLHDPAAAAHMREAAALAAFEPHLYEVAVAHGG